MRVAVSLLLCLAAACAGIGALTPGSLAGTWTLADVSGQPLPTEGEPGVMVRAATLQLDGQGAYTLRLTASVRGAAPVERTHAGRFTVEGDSIQLTGGDLGSVHGTADLDELLLRTEDRRVYRFIRPRR